MKIKTIELTNEEFNKCTEKAHEKLTRDLLEDGDISPLKAIEVTLMTAAFTGLLRELLFDKEVEDNGND